MRKTKKIVDRHSCEAILALTRMGRVRVMKQHTPDGPEYFAYSASGASIGVIGDDWKWMFEDAIVKRGNGDGLFEGFSQTVGTDK